MQSLCCKRFQPLATPRSVLQPLAACCIRNIVCLKVRVSASCVVGCQGWTVAHYCTHRRNTQTCNSTTCIMQRATCSMQQASCNSCVQTMQHTPCKVRNTNMPRAASSMCIGSGFRFSLGPCMRAELKLWCVVHVRIVFLYAVCGMLHVAC